MRLLIIISVGINTSADWERFLQKGSRYGYSRLDGFSRCRNSVESWRRRGKIINERGYMTDDLLPRQSTVHHFHQLYISCHCGGLICDLFRMKEGR